MSQKLLIGGQPLAVLRADPPRLDGPAFVEATVLPGRGLMRLQARLRHPSGETVDAIASSSPADAAQALGGGADDFAGNASFGFGGAILAPFANRIRGRPLPETRAIETHIAGKAVRLPRNWGGREPGAERYAMHGLILDAQIPARQEAPDRIGGRLEAHDFNGRWPGELTFDIEWRLDAGALGLRVTATNTGDELAPVGIGWHPYFALAGGARGQARLRIAARSRVRVNNYDEVLPTGELEALAGGRYDFSEAGGRALGDLYLDDCFTDLDRSADGVLAELRDSTAGVGLRLSSASQGVRAVQVFAPADQAFVAIEPQFNLANPYGAEWAGRDTGMALLPPGATATYDVRVEPFAL